MWIVVCEEAEHGCALGRILLYFEKLENKTYTTVSSICLLAQLKSGYVFDE